HLHRIQDAHGHLSAAQLAALAQDMRLALTEVYEVATFYHHFDVVKEGEAAPAPLTVRVCETLSCRLAGGGELLHDLQRACGPDVRVVGAPCIGRCEHAPAAVVGQNPIDHADVAKVKSAMAQRQLKAPSPSNIAYAEYLKQGGYRLLAQCVNGERDVEDVIAAMEHSGLRGLGGAGFPAGRKWRIVRAEPAPRLMAANIDEGEPGTSND